MTTIDANGQAASQQLVDQALKDCAPKWCVLHGAQFKAWQTESWKFQGSKRIDAVGIGGVSVTLDDTLPQTVMRFFDSSAARTPDPDPVKATDHRNDHIVTTMTLLSEIVNLAVPA